MVAEIFGHFIAEQIQGDRLSAIVDLAFTYPEFAIAAKRGQDRNMPLWLIGAFFAAGVVLDLLTVVGLAGTDDAPSVISLVIAVPFTLFGLALLVELGLRKGTTGANCYGPDPLGPQTAWPIAATACRPCVDPLRDVDASRLSSEPADKILSTADQHDRRSRRHRPRSCPLPFGDAGGRWRAGLFAGRAGAKPASPCIA